MSTAAVSRDPFMPERPPGMRTGLALALIAHALLVAGLAYSVDWHASETAAVEAELWSALPQQAAPRATAPEPTPAPKPAVAPPPAPPPPPPAPSPPAPTPRPAPPPPPPRVDPQIAIEKAREAKRVETQEALAEQEKARRDKARREQTRQDDLERQAAEREKQQARDEQARKKAQADKQLAEKQRADRDKADKAEAAQQAAARAAQLKRLQGLAGASGEDKATGTALKSSGPSASYGGRIVARIKPNIVFPDAVDGNPTAIVEVKVAPDGTITGRRLEQSSGVKAWDDAVLRAIDRTDGLPRDIDGRVPPVMSIKFRPRDL